MSTYTFQTTGDWSTASNWAGGTVPPANIGTANIVLNADCTISTDVSISIEADNITFKEQGDGAGTLLFNNNLTVKKGATLTLNLPINCSTLAQKLEIESGATLNINYGGNVAGQIENGGIINNQEQSSSKSLYKIFTVALCNNTGTINNMSGVFGFQGTNTSNGNINISKGATLQSGTGFVNSAYITNDGQLSLVNTSNHTASVITDKGGVIVNNGTFIMSGAVSFQNEGFFQNSGTFENYTAGNNVTNITDAIWANTGTFKIGSTKDILTFDNDGTIVNNGSLPFDVVNVINSGGQTINSYNFSIAGSWSDANNWDLYPVHLYEGMVINIQQDCNIDTEIIFHGTINIDKRTNLNFETSTSLSKTGTINLSAGSSISTSDASGTLDSYGTINIADLASINTGKHNGLAVYGGSVNIASGGSIINGKGSGIMIKDGGTIVNAGSIENAGYLINDGILTNTPSHSGAINGLGSFEGSFNCNFLQTGSWNEASNWDMPPSLFDNINMYGITFNIKEGETCTIDSGTDVSNYGTMNVNGSLINNGSLTNTGTIDVTATGTFNNTANGTLDSSKGTFKASGVLLLDGTVTDKVLTSADLFNPLPLSTDSIYVVNSAVTLPLTVGFGAPENDAIILIQSGASFTIASGGQLTNNKRIINNGTFTNKGTLKVGSSAQFYNTHTAQFYELGWSGKMSIANSGTIYLTAAKPPLTSFTITESGSGAVDYLPAS